MTSALWLKVRVTMSYDDGPGEMVGNSDIKMPDLDALEKDQQDTRASTVRTSRRRSLSTTLKVDQDRPDHGEADNVGIRGAIVEPWSHRLEDRWSIAAA